MFLAGGDSLCSKVADILLCKSEEASCWEGSGRRLSQQSNGYGRAPLKTNSVSKTVKILSYKNLFQHQGSHWVGNSSVYHFWANLEKMSMLYLRDNSFFKNEHSSYWLLLFGEMFSVFLNCAFLSCLDFSWLYEGQWHKNREMDLTQISLNCLRSARSF